MLLCLSLASQALITLTYWSTASAAAWQNSASLAAADVLDLIGNADCAAVPPEM